MYFLSLVFSACQTETMIERDYPLVLTLKVDHITSDGARYHAVILERSAAEITEYGFVWGNSVVLNINDSEKVLATGSPSESEFYFDIDNHLEEMQKYYVRGFVRSGELIIYGNMVTFVTLAAQSISGESNPTVHQ
jgi:hypothetical protein